MSLLLLGHKVQLGLVCVVSQIIFIGDCPYIVRMQSLVLGQFVLQWYWVFSMKTWISLWLMWS